MKAVIEKEQKILNTFRKLNKKDQEYVESYAKKLLEDQNKNVRKLKNEDAEEERYAYRIKKWES